jgi:hypothetical protein
MGTRLSGFLHSISPGWVVILALLLFVSFTALVAPAQAELAESYAGDAGSPDLSFIYSTGDIYRFAELYGERGREAYIRARFTFDLAFPAVYTLFLTTALSWLSRRAFSPGSRWQRANLSPILAMLFDYGENVSVSLVMARYPERTPVIDWLAPAFTFLKWVLVGASFLLLLVLAAMALLRRASRGDAGTGSPRASDQ